MTELHSPQDPDPATHQPPEHLPDPAHPNPATMSRAELVDYLKANARTIGVTEAYEALFPDPDNVTHNGQSYRLNVYPGGRVELASGTANVKDGSEIVLTKPSDIAKLVEGNLVAAGLKEPNLVGRLGRMAERVRSLSGRDGKIALSGVLDKLAESATRGLDVELSSLDGPAIEPRPATPSILERARQLVTERLKSGQDALDDLTDQVVEKLYQLVERFDRTDPALLTTLTTPEPTPSIGARMNEKFERFKKVFSWERKVQGMDSRRKDIETHLEISGTDEAVLDEYFISYVSDFEGVTDRKEVVKRLSALLLNGKIGLSGTVEAYRKDFQEEGVNLKEIGDYMEFSYEKSLRDRGEMGKVWNARIFRFLQTMSPLSVSLNARGERVAGYKSMQAEQERVVSLEQSFSKFLELLGETGQTPDDPLFQETLENIRKLQTAQETFQVATKNKLYTTDGRTVGWYAGYASGLLLPGLLSTSHRLALAAGVYTADFAAGLSHKHLQAEGLLEGNQLTQEAAKKFSNQVLFNVMKFAAKKSSGEKSISAIASDYLRGTAGASLLSTVFDLTTAFGELIEKTPEMTGAVRAGVTPGIPQIEIPNLEPPTVDLPEIETPEVGLPTIDAPEIDPPTVELPETPEVPEPPLTIDLPKAPEVDLPEMEAPEVELPTADAPATDLPEVDAPEVETPTVDIPDAVDTPAPTLPTEPTTLSKTPDQTWWDIFRGQTNSNAEANLRLMTERILNNDFNLGNSITTVSPEAWETLEQGLREATEIYNQTGSLESLTPLQRLLFSASTGDSDQVALAAISDNMNMIGVSRLADSTVDWTVAVEELKDIIEAQS